MRTILRAAVIVMVLSVPALLAQQARRVPRDVGVPDHQREETLALVIIDKAMVASLPAQDLAALRAVIELRESFLASAPSALGQRLARSDSRIHVVTVRAEGAWFFLTNTPAAREAALARGATELRRVEGDIYLFRGRSPFSGDQFAGKDDATPLTVEGTVPLSLVVHAPPIATAGSTVRAIRDHPVVSMTTADVSRERIAATIRALQDMQSRASTTAGNATAAQYVYDAFRGLGLSTVYEDFTYDRTYAGTVYRGIRASNVVATIPGTVTPSDVVLVGAHYDSFVSPWPSAPFAPGADDNGSGTAAVLEMARVVAGQPFDFTIRFVAFGSEEDGLVGSRYHAQRARQNGDRIIAMIDLDMVAYADRQPEDLNVIVNARSAWLAAKYADAAARFGAVGCATLVDPTVRGSDHSPFWDQGYFASLSIEDSPLTSPHWHRATDTVDTLDLEFATAATRTGLAVLVDLAQPSSSPAPPASLTARSWVSRSLFSRGWTVQLTWPASTGSSGGYHVYRSTTPHSGYTRLTTSPVRTTGFVDRFQEVDATYYYTVTAVDGSGREGNRSTEVAHNGIRY
jgi:hypothetical protein